MCLSLFSYFGLVIKDVTTLFSLCENMKIKESRFKPDTCVRANVCSVLVRLTPKWQPYQFSVNPSPS